MVGVSEGLDLSNLDETTPEEINANLIRVWSWRGPLYEMYANSLMLDYAPDFAKLHRCGSATGWRHVPSGRDRRRRSRRAGRRIRRRSSAGSISQPVR